MLSTIALFLSSPESRGWPGQRILVYSLRAGFSHRIISSMTNVSFVSLGVMVVGPRVVLFAYSRCLEDCAGACS